MTLREMSLKYELGNTLEEIAEMCGVSSSTVRRRLLEEGVHMRRPGARPSVLKEVAEVTRESSSPRLETHFSFIAKMQKDGTMKYVPVK